MNVPNKQKLFDALRDAGLGGPYWLARSPFLRQNGWFLSFVRRQSVDERGQPLPWWSYSFRRFLEGRLTKDMRVFEYGSGNSTVWLSARVLSIKAVEDDASWATHVRTLASSNVEVVFEGDQDAYVRSSGDELYDVIIVDGKWRVECVGFAVNQLTERGILVLDDTERELYAPAFRLMKSRGFREISIGGLGALSNDLKETTIFYRSGNCLGI